MNAERILKLAEYLEHVDATRFNIASWYDRFRDGYEYEKRDEILSEIEKDQRSTVLIDHYGDKVPIEVLVKEGTCGSTACALGHAALMPEFNQQGLWMVWTPAHGGTRITYIDPETLESHTGSEAGARFFEMPDAVAGLLFYTENSGVSYNFYHDRSPTEGFDGRYYGDELEDICHLITPTQVAKKLREYVEDPHIVDSYVRFIHWIEFG